MATVYSTQKTQWEQDSPTTKIKPNEFGGRIRVAYGFYEAAAVASGIETTKAKSKAKTC